MGCLVSKPRKKHHLSDNFVVERHKSVEDDYTLLEKIGQGSIGVIYMAESKRPKYCMDEDVSMRSHGSSVNSHRGDKNKKNGLPSTSATRSTQKYAIKQIDTNMIDKRALQSLKTEIKLLKTLDHPFVIKFFGSYSTVVSEGGRENLSVVMELCTGGALDKYVPYDEGTAIILVANIVEAVLYLHSHNIIHRDLKNENVMFVDKDRDPNNIRLLDFGLAKIFSRSQPIRDRAGTVYSMSPEALRGEYDETADMWSLGVLTYHLLTGKRPFWGDTKSAIARKVVAARYSMVGPEWENVSREAKSFVRECLQFEPLLRYSPVEALKSPWLRKHTEFNIKSLSKNELGVLKMVQDSNPRRREMEKLALYAIAHKARSEDMAKLRKLFLGIAMNNKREITLPEMERALEGQFTKEQIREWFSRADIDGNGSINFTEFVSSSFDAQSKLSSQDIIDAFRVFDRDDSGFITASNLREALQIDQGEYIDKLIHEIDVAGDGQISFREFRNFLMKNQLKTPIEGG